MTARDAALRLMMFRVSGCRQKSEWGKERFNIDHAAKQAPSQDLFSPVLSYLASH